MPLRGGHSSSKRLLDIDAQSTSCSTAKISTVSPPADRIEPVEQTSRIANWPFKANLNGFREHEVHRLPCRDGHLADLLDIIYHVLYMQMVSSYVSRMR